MRVAAAFWVLAGAVVLTGCAEKGGDPPSESVRTPPELAAPAGTSPEEEALDAYRGMWDVVVEGSHDGAVGHPDLSEYATGQALELTSAMLRGVYATGEPQMSPKATEAAGSPPSVSIEDCIDDSEWTVQEEPGAEERSGRRSVTATVTAHGDQWLVEDLWFEDYGSC